MNGGQERRMGGRKDEWEEGKTNRRKKPQMEAGRGGVESTEGNGGRVDKWKAG